MNTNRDFIYLIFQRNLIVLPFFIILLCLKINDINLPYFWDEAWSYIPAIKAMALKGPSLMPGSVAPELYRGHPLFFYFIASLWIKIFGDSIWITRMLPLIISFLLMYSMYILIKNVFNYKTAFFTLLFFTIQSIFIAQSTFLLPETLLALFTVLSFNSFITGKKYYTAIWLTLAVFTKESGFIILFSITCFEVWNSIKKHSKIIGLVKSSFYLFIPYVLISVFFVLQRIKTGWFLFPQHLNFISITEFVNKFSGYSTYIFVFMGRNLLTFAGITCIIFLLIKRNKEFGSKKNNILYFTVFIILYLIFSALNFYSPRYVLSVFPFIIALFIHAIIISLKTKRIFFFVVIVLLLLNNVWFTFHDMRSNDHNLGYRDMVRVHMKMVSYCEENDMYEKNIFAPFLMHKNLTNADLGYLSKKSTFKNVKSNIDSTTEYVLLSNIDAEKIYYGQIKNFNGVLLKRFNQKKCWAEIYFIEH